MKLLAVFYAILISHLPELPPAEAFRSYANEEGVEISIAETEGRTAWVHARVELPYSLAHVSKVLKNFEQYGSIFDKSLDRALVIERKGDAIVRMHQVWDLPFPFRNRDSIVEYQFQETENGALLFWSDAVMPGDPATGIRMEKVQGMTKLTARGDSATEIELMYYGELGEDFPNWARRISYREEPVNCFNGIRKALEELVKLEEAR